MIIGGHKLTQTQQMSVDSASAKVMTSQVDWFFKFVGAALRAKQVVRDTDVRHACCAGLVKLGAVRE
jgi:hypothetical protein